MLCTGGYCWSHCIFSMRKASVKRRNKFISIFLCLNCFPKLFFSSEKTVYCYWEGCPCNTTVQPLLRNAIENIPRGDVCPFWTVWRESVQEKLSSPTHHHHHYHHHHKIFSPKSQKQKEKFKTYLYTYMQPFLKQ